MGGTSVRLQVQASPCGVTCIAAALSTLLLLLWHPLQVALLFLVKGPIHHETMWRLWFQTAAGLLPVQSVMAALCNRGNGSSSSSSPTSGRLQRQALDACSSSGGAPAAATLESQPSPSQEPAAEARQVWPGQGAAAAIRALLTRSAQTSELTAASRRVLFSGHTQGSLPSGDVLGQQLLFDVYVHPHPSFEGVVVSWHAVVLPACLPACLLASLPGYEPETRSQPPAATRRRLLLIRQVRVRMC
jgi:hypothetical protein